MENKNTIKLNKKQRQLFYNYKNSNMHSLRDLYIHCSYEKQDAEQDIIREMLDANGYGFKICGGNSCTFSCAYCYDLDGFTHLVYHTYANKHDFIVDIAE